MSKRVKFGAVALTILLLASPLAAQESEKQHDKQYNQQVARVLDTLKKGERNEVDQDTLYWAIQSAASSKITKAVPSLIKLLTFKYVPPAEREPGSGVGQSGSGARYLDGAMYPAVDALFSIGSPALPALVKVIKHCDSDSLMAQNANYAFSGIFRENPQAGVDYLEKQAAETNSADEKQRLVVAIRHMKRLIHPEEQP